MALKPDRIEFLSDISFFMTSIPAGSTSVDRGGVASVVTTSSGVGVSMVVSYASSPSGAKPVGILLNDVVSLDLTRQHINWHRDEVQVGGKVALLRNGQVTTNLVGGTPSAGADAYVAASGYISSVQATGAVKIGQFLSAKDSDGYAKVSVNL
jgi:hypothetical protein